MLSPAFSTIGPSGTPIAYGPAIAEQSEAIDEAKAINKLTVNDGTSYYPYSIKMLSAYSAL